MEELSNVDTVLELNKNKKIDWFLKLRIIILIVLAVFFAFVVVFDIFSYHVNPWPVTWFFSIGALSGYLWFHRMTPIHWDEESQIMKIRRFDFTGFFFVILYLIGRIVLKNVIDANVSSVVGVSIATYSAACGVMVGRVFGISRVIHIIHTDRNSVVGK